MAANVQNASGDGVMMAAKILVSTENLSYADWLEYRKQGISRYKSPVELCLKKTDQLPAQEAGEAAYWGTQLMLANLDGICEVPDVGTCIFEAKTASEYKASEWEDAIPDEYALAHYSDLE